METYLKAIEDHPTKGTRQSEMDAINENWKNETDGALADLYASILVLCVKSRMYFEATGFGTRILRIPSFIVLIWEC